MKAPVAPSSEPSIGRAVARLGRSCGARRDGGQFGGLRKRRSGFDRSTIFNRLFDAEDGLILGHQGPGRVAGLNIRGGCDPPPAELTVTR